MFYPVFSENGRESDFSFRVLFQGVRFEFEGQELDHIQRGDHPGVTGRRREFQGGRHDLVQYVLQEIQDRSDVNPRCFLFVVPGTFFFRLSLSIFRKGLVDLLLRCRG